MGGSSVRVPVGMREHGFTPAPLKDCTSKAFRTGVAFGHKFVFIYFQRIWKVIGGRSATPLVHSLAVLAEGARPEFAKRVQAGADIRNFADIERELRRSRCNELYGPTETRSPGALRHTNLRPVVYSRPSQLAAP